MEIITSCLTSYKYINIMNLNQGKVSVFLAILGTVLMVLCAGLYIFTKWRKEELRTGDIIATCFISAASLIVFTIALIYCFKCWSVEPHQKETYSKTTYIPVKTYMGSNCGICIEPKDSIHSTIVKLTCDHTFHKECVTRSLETQQKCPICRQIPSKFSSFERVIYWLHGSIQHSFHAIKSKEIVIGTPV